jgi:hypothetical protein
MSNRELYDSTRRLLHTEADLALQLHVFGDSLQERDGFPAGLMGIEAVHFLLIQKYRWLPRDVKSMSAEDMRLALADEMDDWVLPEDAKFKD